MPRVKFSAVFVAAIFVVGSAAAQSATEYFRVAFKENSAGRYLEAIELYKEGLKLDPKNYRAHAELAKIYKEKYFPDELVYERLKLVSELAASEPIGMKALAEKNILARKIAQEREPAAERRTSLPQFIHTFHSLEDGTKFCFRIVDFSLIGDRDVYGINRDKSFMLLKLWTLDSAQKMSESEQRYQVSWTNWLGQPTFLLEATHPARNLGELMPSATLAPRDDSGFFISSETMDAVRERRHLSRVWSRQDSVKNCWKNS